MKLKHPLILSISLLLFFGMGGLYAQRDYSAVDREVKQAKALGILKKAIEANKQNNLAKYSGVFSMKSHNKILLTIDPDNIPTTVDTLYLDSKKGYGTIVIDSFNNFMHKRLQRHHLFISEKISEFYYQKGVKKKELVLASRMAGFKEPIFEVIGLNFQDMAFDKKTYTILQTKFTNPLTRYGLKKYDYSYEGMEDNGNGCSYIIGYKRKESKTNKIGIDGLIHIDSSSYAITKSEAILKNFVQIKATQYYHYYAPVKTWVPKNAKITVEKLDKKDNIALIDYAVNLYNGHKVDTIIQRQIREAINHGVFTNETVFYDYKTNNTLINQKKKASITLGKNALNKSPEYWNRARRLSFGKKEEETYRVIDSLSVSKNIEDKLLFSKRLLKGYVYTKYIDINLGKLFAINNYEGFRFGLGGTTNANFSNLYRLQGYTAYGTKDNVLKYHFGAAFRINEKHDTWIGAYYTDDLKESAVLDFLPENNSFTATNTRNINIADFYKYKTYNIDFRYEINPKLESLLDVRYGKYKPVFTYGYQGLVPLGEYYPLATATVHFKFMPFSRFMKVPNSKLNIQKGYPVFQLQVRQSFKNILDSNFDFTQINFKANYKIQRLRRATTSFLLQGGKVFGEAPISHLYNATPNAVFYEPWRRRILFAGKNTFETMGFNEFISEEYAMLQAKHSFRPFFKGSINLQLAIVSRFAFGGMDHASRHEGLDFKTMEQGYFESGLEMNSIIYGLGFGAFYRYGPYAKLNEIDNIAIKLSYKLQL